MRKMIYTDKAGCKHDVVFMGIATDPGCAEIAIPDEYHPGKVYYNHVPIGSLQFTTEDFNKFFAD